MVQAKDCVSEADRERDEQPPGAEKKGDEGAEKPARKESPNEKGGDFPAPRSLVNRGKRHLVAMMNGQAIVGHVKSFSWHGSVNPLFIKYSKRKTVERNIYRNVIRESRPATRLGTGCRFAAGCQSRR